MKYIYRELTSQEILISICYGKAYSGENATEYPPVPRMGEMVKVQGNRIVMRVTHDPMDRVIFIDLGSPL
jgi:hypothetical protein